MDLVIIITVGIWLFLVIVVIWTFIKNKKLSVQNTKLKTTLEERERQNVFLQNDFSKLAANILKQNTSQITNQNNSLLNPLKNDIEKFKTRIEELNKTQSNERVKLSEQIKNLEKHNLDILAGAKDLTNALTYDNKAQGDWGEVQLEMILQGSGLKEGQEYHKQQGFRGEDNKLYKPDFIVHLPNNKDIVIDAKVSLKDYNDYVGGNKEALKAHLKSINNHINNISLKVYENLEGVNSLDFIFVFFPIEASLLVALEVEPDLFNNAIKKNIALVSPSTLMMSLKVVSHIWDIEKQNKNTEEIVRLASRMHDKFFNFITDLDKVKKSLDNANKSYEDAKRKLEGRDNAISIAKNIEELGVKNKKQLL
jgi:DNA recombination protein RmuC